MSGESTAEEGNEHGDGLEFGPGGVWHGLTNLGPTEPLTYRYTLEPRKPAFGLEPGVSRGYLVQWSGEPGPAKILTVAALVDDDGIWTLLPDEDAEWTDTTVVDNTPSEEEAP